ncbi:MAG: hypothetical protein R2751_00715 [Bacteroidales bacterium]
MKTLITSLALMTCLTLGAQTRVDLMTYNIRLNNLRPTGSMPGPTAKRT